MVEYLIIPEDYIKVCDKVAASNPKYAISKAKSKIKVVAVAITNIHYDK